MTVLGHDRKHQTRLVGIASPLDSDSGAKANLMEFSEFIKIL